MRPITVTTTVPDDIAHVYEFLDVAANHEQFTDHMLQEWHCSGPERGVGAVIDVVSVAAGRRVPVRIEVVEADEPRRIVERNSSAGGRRVATGTYELESQPAGGTLIAFTYAWERVPFADRAMTPLVRSVMRRALERSMQRLRETLAARPASDRAAA